MVKAECNVCHYTQDFEKTADGLFLLPRHWQNMEDRRPTRTRPMVTVCSEKCVRTLKEQNQVSTFRKKPY